MAKSGHHAFRTSTPAISRYHPAQYNAAMQVQPPQQMHPPQMLPPQETQEPEDPKRQLCRRLSKASYLESVHELVAEATQSYAAILQTWPAIFEHRGFSAFTAALTVAPGFEVLLVSFRGTVGTPEWLSYPGALAGEPFMCVEGLTGFAPFVDAVQKIWHRPGDGVCDGGPPSTMGETISRSLDAGRQVWLTGHSRGGAIAQLAAALLACGEDSRESDANLSRVSIMTFNAPRVLCAADIARYERARQVYAIEHRRIEHRGDLVRHMPPGLGLKHGGDSEMHGESVIRSERIVGTALSAVRAFAAAGTGGANGNAAAGRGGNILGSLAQAFVRHAAESHR